MGVGNAMGFGRLACVLPMSSLGSNIDHGPEADYPNFVILSNPKKVKRALVLLPGKEPPS